MSARILASALRAPLASTARSASIRSFQSSAPKMADAPAVRRPVGGIRGGLFGFLLGSTGAGAAVYYYILEEYRISNTLLTEDIYKLQAAVQRIEAYTRTLEEKLDAKK